MATHPALAFSTWSRTCGTVFRLANSSTTVWHQSPSATLNPTVPINAAAPSQDTHSSVQDVFTWTHSSAHGASAQFVLSGTSALDASAQLSWSTLPRRHTCSKKHSRTSDDRPLLLTLMLALSFAPLFVFLVLLAFHPLLVWVFNTFTRCRLTSSPLKPSPNARHKIKMPVPPERGSKHPFSMPIAQVSHTFPSRRQLCFLCHALLSPSPVGKESTPASQKPRADLFGSGITHRTSRTTSTRTLTATTSPPSSTRTRSFLAPRSSPSSKLPQA